MHPWWLQVEKVDVVACGGKCKIVGDGLADCIFILLVLARTKMQFVKGYRRTGKLHNIAADE